METGNFGLTLPARPEFVKVARLTVGGLGTVLGFDFNATEDLKLAVNEALNLMLSATPANGVVELAASWTDAALDVAMTGPAGADAADDEDAAICVMVIEGCTDRATVERSADRLSVRFAKLRA
jgi:hypothetical protein